MRLVLFDGPPKVRARFHPLALSRPIWELRCGITTLGEKLIARLRASDVACWVPEHMAPAYRETTDMSVNEPKALAGDDLLLVNGRVKAETFDPPGGERNVIALDEDGELLYAYLQHRSHVQCSRDSFDAFCRDARELVEPVKGGVETYNYLWDLILGNPEQIAADFRALARSGIEGTVEAPGAVRGSEKDVYVAPGARVHPMVVLDAENGPIYLDRDVEVHPFTRIEGPCFVGAGSVLLGTKCREGNSIGPVCRVGGEVEESIIQGYANKYHDGFLGHAYVGEWVNLGALTTNSDLKNDYSSVSVTLDGRQPIDTGSTKVGSLIGDHTKTSIGVLFNTGAYVGAMALIMATGKPLPKFIPSFAWLLDGAVTKGFGRKALYQTAAVAMGRRQRRWTDAQEAMWEAIYERTAPARDKAIKRGRRTMFRK